MKRSAIVLLVFFLVASLALPAFARSNGSAGKGAAKNSATTKTSDKSVTTKAKQLVISTAKQDKIKQALRNVQSVSDYTDTKSHWGSQAIKKAKALGLVTGYEDGSFKPDATVSALEATVLAVRVAETIGTSDAANATNEQTITSNTTSNETTTDVPDASIPEWSKQSVSKANALKIININRFHSQVQATRAQAAVMLAKALNLQPVSTEELPFPDLASLTAEDLGYLVALQQAGIIHGSPDGKFNPNSSLTRAEIAAMLANIADKSVDNPAETGTSTSTTTTPGTDTAGTTTGTTGTTNTTGTTDTTTTNSTATGTDTNTSGTTPTPTTSTN